MLKPSGTEIKILDQQIRLLYSQSSTAVVVSAVVALLVAYYLGAGQNSVGITSWVIFITLASLSRLYLFHQFSRKESKSTNLNFWLRWHMLASFFGGTSWGMLGFLYDPSWTVEQQVAFFVVIAGMATAAISSYAAVLKSYVVFLTPLLSLLIALLITNESQSSEFLCFIVLVFGVGLIGVARNYNAHIVNSLRLVVEREDLLKAVTLGSEQLQKTENFLHASERRFGHILESSLDGYWDWDTKTNKVFFSKRYKEQLGFKDHELPNDFLSWESRLHPDEQDEMLAKIRAYLENPKGYWEEKFRLRHKDGSYRWILARAVPSFDSQNTLIKLTGLHIDITDRVQAEHKLNFMSCHDWLTELPNRSLLIDRLEHALAKAKRNRTQVFLLVLGLDRFQHINDSLGHSAGDIALREVSKRFAKLIREEDTIARLGGDEFAILLENTSDSRNVVIVAERLLVSLNQPLFVEDQQIYLSTSIGIGAFPSDGEAPTTLLKNADAAMHRAKRNGRNRFHFYSEEITEMALRHIKLEYGLRQALLQNQFQVYYQPKICLKSGQILGAEALLRWLHPEGGFISPQDFIPVAEESGLIMEIGQWILTQACKEAAFWKQQGLAFQHVAVNISGVQIQHAGFVGSVKEILDSSGFPAELLELEVTENFLMEDAEASARLLGELRQLGISIAIDDFGTGYSSLAYLTRFPVNKLKIDRSFIGRACSDPHNAEISRAIISLGHALNMEVVAEGIELEQQLNFLKNEGCDEGQGYLIAKPLPHDDFVAFLKMHANGFTNLLPSGAPIQNQLYGHG